MGEAKFNFPRGKNVKALCQFSKEMAELPKQEELGINASTLKFATPTDLIFLAKSCGQRRRMYRSEKRLYYGLSKLNYANNLGFSEALQIKDKPFRQGAFGGKSYLPISLLSRKELEESAELNAHALQDEIELQCGKLSKVVSQDRSKDLRSALTRSFCEIIRNSFEHGDAAGVHYCAQHWPKLKQVEICIADRGMGIATSLANGKYNIPENDREALLYSLMPGVSSKAWMYKKKRASQKTHWDNAGYGLFFAHQLFGNLGHFMIASGEKALFLSRDSFKEYDCYVDGTIVSMKLDLSEENRIADELRSHSDRAAKIRERLGVKSLQIKSIEALLKANDLP